MHMEPVPRRGHRRPRRRFPRWVVPLAVAVLVADLGVAYLVSWRVDGSLGGPTPRPGTKLTAAQQEDRAAPAADRDEEVREAISGVLDQRAKAVRSRDLEAFLSTVDPRADEVRESQEEWFGHLEELPISTWEYDLVDTGAYTVPEERQEELGGTTLGVSVRLSYRIQRVDEAAVSATEHLTLVQRGERWLVAGTNDRKGEDTERQLWDFGKVTVIEGDHSLVMGLASTSRLRSYAREADRAVPAVTKVWGESWSRHVVILAPESDEQMAKLLGGEPSDYDQIAAVTTGEMGPSFWSVPADRITVNPSTYHQLGPLGRRIVMTHEVTHVATRGLTKPWTPMWLTEGFADYVGYLDSGVSVRAAASELVKDVRAGRVPERLPADEDFEMTTDNLAQAYEMSWLACKLIADEYGQDKLVEFYREVGRLATNAEERAFTEVLDTTPAEFTDRWRAYLENLA